MNNSGMHLNNLIQSQTPYSNYLRYSNTITSGPSWTNKNKQNLWKSVECSSKPSINEKSKRIANMKKTTNISVHDRLHQQALSKQKIEKREAQNNSFSIENRFDISELNPEEKRKRYKRRKGKSMNAPSRASLNYGIRLYQKGIKQIEEIERKYKEALAAKEENELKDLTFQPKINPVSFYFGTKGSERPEEHLIKHGQMIKDKIDQKRAEIMYYNQKAWSFRPKINANSKNIAEQRSKFFEDDVVAEEHSNKELVSKPDQFIHLYEDAMNRLERHNKIYSMWIDSECTFKPDIGKTRHKNVSHKYNQSKNIISEKSLIEKFNNENFDQITGQPLFQPKIGRSPTNKHHRSSQSIGNMLYNDNKIYQDKLDQIKREQENKLKNDMNSKYCK